MNWACYGPPAIARFGVHVLNIFIFVIIKIKQDKITQNILLKISFHKDSKFAIYVVQDLEKAFYSLQMQSKLFRIISLYSFGG